VNTLDKYDALIQNVRTNTGKHGHRYDCNMTHPNCTPCITVVVDHVDCRSCGKSYDAERKDPRVGSTCCGECGCTDPKLVKVTTLR